MSYSNIITEIAILMVYVFIGYVLRRIKLVSENGIGDISRIIVNVAMPLLVLNSMLIEYKEEYVNNILILALCAVLFMAFTSFISSRIVKYLRGEESQKKAMHYCMIFGNCAFLGYPICSALFGPIGMFYASIYVVIQNFYQWTLGVNIFKQEKISGANLKNLINPGIVAITIGLTMFFLDIRPPAIVARVITGIGNISIPLALMMIGANLYGYKITEIATDKSIQAISIFKTLVFPLVLMGVIFFLPIDNMIKSILTIQASAPIQASAAVFVKNFRGDSVIPSKGVFLSTILCLATVPLFLIIINL